MAAVDILTKFEVNLSQNVVQDILTSGKTFESEIWSQKEADCSAGSSVLLQKLGDSIFKLLVTVYKPPVSPEDEAKKVDSSDISMQTEKKIDGVKTQTEATATEHISMQTDDEKRAQLESASMQTEKQATAVLPTQTDAEKKAQLESASMQTEKQATAVLPTQTDAEKKAELESASMQTEKQATAVLPTQTEAEEQAQLESASVQTDKTGTGVLPTQTNVVVTDEISMQTDPKVANVLPTQTPSKSFNESFMQTEEKMFVDSCMQTDSKDIVSSDAQTEIMCFERFEQICQTQIECNDQNSQTELVQVDSECQTLKDEQSIETQTVIKEFSEMVIQTDSSMALLVEQDCQASVEVFDGECQAVVELAESEAQAAVDMQEGECQATVDYCEGECQAVVTQTENECQATTETTEGDCQAVVELIDGDSQVELEYSEADCQASIEQFDGECQAVVDQADGDCQVTPPDGTEMEAQTDSSFWQLADNESQTEKEKEEEPGDQILTPMKSGRSVCMQTEAIRIKTKISQTDAQTDGMCEDVPVEIETKLSVAADAPTDINNTAPQTLPPTEGEMPVNDLPPPPTPAEGEQQVEGQLDPSMISIMNVQDGMMAVGLDGHMLQGDMGGSIVSIQPVAKFGDQGISITPLRKEEKEGREMSCQTDPVTIIIGDASFLVNRLKDSSSRPARINQNEIEIEVGPDSDKKDMFSFGSRRGFRQPIKHEPGRGQVRQQSTPKPRIKKEKNIARLPEMPPPQEPEPVQRLPPPGSDQLGQFSCPFCALTFHESPALYEHLQVDHGNITSSSKSKTPRSAGKGRGGGAAGGRKRPSNPPPELQPNDIIEPIDGQEDQDQGPPILTPYQEGEEYSEEAELAAQREQEEMQKRKQMAKDAYDQAPGEDDGPGLFEDIPEPKTKKRRNATRELQERNKSVFPPLPKKSHSNIELDCPMCSEKFGGADLLYLHIRRYHKDEDNSRKRTDVVNALMHDKLAETPELLPERSGNRRRRRLPMVATDSTSDSPAKRRRTREVIEEFEESLIEDMAPQNRVDRQAIQEQQQLDMEEEAAAYEEEEERRVENLVEKINPDDDDDEEDEHPHLEGEEEMPTHDMLENMVEVVVQEPGEQLEEDGAEERGDPEEELQGEEQPIEEEEEEDPEPAELVEAIEPVEGNGLEESEEEFEQEEEAAVEETEPSEEFVPAEKSGLRRTRHSLKGQGPPKSKARTRGGKRN